MHFNAQFKTKEILSFIVQYPFEKGFDDIKEDNLIEFMTGLNPQNKDYFEKVFQTSDYSKLTSKITLQTACVDEIIKQNPILKNADETCDVVFTKLKKDKNEIKTWLNFQMKKIGETVDIEPFKLDIKKLVQSYKELEKMIDSIGF